MQSEQHYRVGLSDAVAHYNNGDLTAKGLLHFYFKIRIAPGWTLKETQKEICDRIGISRAAFYTALSKLKAEGSINWSAPSDTRFSISLPVCECRPPSTDKDSQSTTVDTTSTYIDTTSTIVDSESTTVENEPPEQLENKGSSDSPDFFSNSSSNFSSVSLRTRAREEKKQEGFFQEGEEEEILTPLETAEASTNSSGLTQQSSIRVNISPRGENGSQSQIRQYDSALGTTPKEDRRTRQQQQFDWVPDGEWKLPDGRLAPNFVDWLAKQWVRDFGGDIHAKRRDVLLHFKKDAANVAIAWDSYHREALHRVAVAATSVASGMSESHLAKEIAHVQPYLKAAASPGEYSPVAYTVPAAVQEFAPQIGAAIEQRINGASVTEIIGSLPANSPSNPVPDLGEIDESVEAYKPFVAPPVNPEEQAENLKRLSELTKSAIKGFGGSDKPPETDEARLERLNRMLADPITRSAAMKIILANEDYEVEYGEEGNPISVKYLPF